MMDIFGDPINKRAKGWVKKLQSQSYACDCGGRFVRVDTETCPACGYYTRKCEEWELHNASLALNFGAHKTRRPYMSDQVKQLIRDNYSWGYTMKEIAEKLDVAETSVFRAIHANPSATVK
jgi:hypothetical protein